MGLKFSWRVILLVVHEIAEIMMVLVLHVNAQVTRRSEYGFAFLADEALSNVCHDGGGGRFFAVHPLLMAAEVIVACEVFRAVCAVIRFQFRVHKRVTSEMVASIEAVLAQLAFVCFRAVDLLFRLLSCTLLYHWRWIGRRTRMIRIRF